MRKLTVEEVELLVLDIESEFANFKNIELIKNGEVKRKLERAFVVLPNNDGFKKWENAIKRSIKFSITTEFVESFLRGELLLSNLSKTEIDAFKDYGRTGYKRLKANNLLVPVFEFQFEKIAIKGKSPREKWLQFILENSLSEGVKKYKLMNFFSGSPEQHLSGIEEYLNSRAKEMLKDEFDAMNRMLNKHIGKLATK